MKEVVFPINDMIKRNKTALNRNISDSDFNIAFAESKKVRKWKSKWG